MVAPKPKVCEMDQLSMTGALQSYLMNSPAPFQWGAYCTLKNSQAANGEGLCLANDFVVCWLQTFPTASSGGLIKFTDSLSQLISLGVLSRFPIGHRVFEGLSMSNPSQKKIFVDRCYSKVQCIFYHLRRLKSNSVKRRQCLDQVEPKQKEILEHMISLVPAQALKDPPVPGGAVGKNKTSLAQTLPKD